MSANGLLFLGAGATAGAGLKTRDKHILPADQKFFDSCLVKSLFTPEQYPALHHVRTTIPSVSHPSLFQTWNSLFVYRGLVWNKIIEDPQGFDLAVLEKWIKQIRDSDQGQHYECQKKIAEKEGRPPRYYLAEIAIWDLRRLALDVYGAVDLSGTNVYAKLWESIGDRFQAVVNLNYDTTFDDSLKDRGNPIIRPHGSLNRSEWNVYHLNDGKRGWEHKPWKEIPKDPKDNKPAKCLNPGYKPVENEPDCYRLEQPLIVTPAMPKEEVIGNSSASGNTGGYLNYAWKAAWE